jgi:maltooligosyltrehalose trehalohydrolase
MSEAAGWQMTIGAQPLAEGVRFRVWAPRSREVDVVVYGPSLERIHPLDPEPGGYFAADLPGVAAGARYRYRLDGRDAYPDPATRSQPDGVHGPSEVVDPTAFAWRTTGWQGVAADDLVIYELHVGTFTEGGTFDAAVDRLDELAALGVTAIEVMPIANFPGKRNWGYDGVNLFAPATAYGGVDGFKRLVDEAHRCGLGVILDVVYNHLGPEGNYLPALTGGMFFTDRYETPWGEAVNVDGEGSAAVRDFIIQNALHWLTEYRVDGLRLDATHAITDRSRTHILADLARHVRELPGPRRVLIAEDDRNELRLLLPPEEGGYGLDGVWADDLHHQLRRHVAGDHESYFARYGGTMEDIVATLRRGWWRTRETRAARGVAPRKERSPATPAEAIPPFRFVHCIQNHDQVGNRATGDRLNHEIPPGTFRAVSTLLLTTPYTPLLFMGQEWAASSPFLYFTDHPEELGRLVTEGRREEFKQFSAFTRPERRDQIPDPQAETTFLRSRLDWSERTTPGQAGVLRLYRALLAIRSEHPALRRRDRGSFDVATLGEGALAVRRSDDEGELLVVVNLRGEIRLDLPDLQITRPPRGAQWSYLLATEETRFGGDGGWGRLEAAGVLHVVQEGAVLLGC